MPDDGELGRHDKTVQGSRRARTSISALLYCALAYAQLARYTNGGENDLRCVPQRYSALMVMVTRYHSTTPVQRRHVLEAHSVKTTEARDNSLVATMMVLILCLALSLSGVLMGAPAVQAADTHNTWTQLPLYGGSVYALAVNPVDPAILYAGTNGGGVFRSTDSGTTWVAVNTGFITNTLVASLAIDPLISTILYAGTNGSGIFRSTDSGTTWVAVNTGLTDMYVLCLAIDPLTSTTLYAGTETRGVFRSTDSGAHWTAVNTDLTYGYMRVTSLAIDPVTPTTLYVGTFGEGVLRSTDSGAHWTGLRTTISKEGVTSLAIDPLSRTILYAGTQDGIFRSRDSGATWTALNTGLASKWIQSLTIDPLTPTTLYACTETGGIFCSTNSGTTWTAVNNGIASESANCLIIDPVTPAILYVGCTGYVRAPGGIFRSTDSGTTWRAANAGIANTWVQRLAIDPLTPTTIYAVTDTDILRSTDSGATWKGLNTDIMDGDGTYVSNLAIDPITPTILYAQTSNQHYEYSIFRSADSGATWTALDTTGPTRNCVQSLVAIDPITPTILYASAFGGSVFRSTDRGDHWTTLSAAVDDQGIPSLVIDPLSPTTLYAGTNDHGVFRSTDSGATWTAVNAGLTSKTIQFLVIDPLRPTILYADTDSGIFRSTDSGATWRMVSTDLVKGSVTSLIIDPLAPTTLYASTGGGGAFCSIDSGTTWTAMNTGLTNTRVTSLVIDPLTSTTLYAGTGGGGVFRYSAVPSSTLTTTSSPASGGTIARSPDQSSYLSGTVVTLTATPATGYSFTGWSGDLSSTGNLATITMDADKTVTANFTNPPAYTLTPSFGSGGTMTPNTRQTVAQDGGTTFTITPKAGYHIADVTIDGVSQGPISSYAFTGVKADHVIQARFEADKEETVIVLQIGKTTFTVNGSSKTLDSSPVIKNGRTLVSIRAIIEALGGTIGWDGTARKATVTLGSATIELWIGKGSATVNGVSTPIDATNAKVVPEIISGRTMLPLRFVSESFGCSVSWTNATRTITIAYQQ
jgi:uncharacterized repeat protein (TIGR02543 family)